MAGPVTERIEDRLGTAAWARPAEGATASASARFLTEILPRFVFPETTLGVLEAFSGLDVKAEELARLLERNPYYERQFRTFVETLGKRDHVPSVGATVVLLGMQRSRDLILAMQMHRTLTGAHVPWSPDGKLGLVPADLLACTAKCDDPAPGSREPWAVAAFVGGFLFDWTLQLARATGRDLKALAPFAETIFKHGQRAARVAVALAPLLPELSLRRYLYSAALVHDLGRVILALLEPTYPEVHAEMEKASLPPLLRLHVERARFGVSHELLGGAACEATGALRPVSRAILYHHEPALLKREGKALHLFGSLLAFSSNVANAFRKPEGKDEAAVLARWKGPELRDFPLDLKKAEPIVARLVSSGQ